MTVREPVARIRHLAKKVRGDGAVMAMCFKSPRAIDMKRATWTTDRNAVTCQNCLALMRTFTADATPANSSPL